jgi:hypothetical protein
MEQNNTATSASPFNHQDQHQQQRPQLLCGMKRHASQPLPCSNSETKVRIVDGSLTVTGTETSWSKQERRAQALNKYKAKRKNLNFTKKIRYETRKQLAQARPRIKGQFVKVSGSDAAEATGKSAKSTADDEQKLMTLSIEAAAMADADADGAADGSGPADMACEEEDDVNSATAAEAVEQPESDTAVAAAAIAEAAAEVAEAEGRAAAAAAVAAAAEATAMDEEEEKDVVNSKAPPAEALRVVEQPPKHVQLIKSRPSKVKTVVVAAEQQSGNKAVRPGNRNGSDSGSNSPDSHK